MWKDSETGQDFLDFDYLISILNETISNEQLLPSSIGVYGDWGSGKSSLIKMSMNELEENDENVCLVFNGWLFEGYEDAKTALMGSILDKIQEKRTISAKAKTCILGLYKSVDKLKLLKSGVKYGLDFVVTGGIGTIADITFNSIASKISGKTDDFDLEKIKDSISDELSNKSIREDLRNFRENFNELLKETKINRLVIFIDELDRCSPETILETLEAIRLFLFVGNAVFIIGADERHISYAVKKKFEDIQGTQIDIGKEYLEKMIQYPVRIPRLNTKEVEFYITCLLFQKELDTHEFDQIITFLNSEKNKDFINFSISYDLISKGLPELAEKIKDSVIVGKQLSMVLASGLNGNPRHCKRFLNSLVMREQMAKYKSIQLDRSILAKIMMLEYFKLPLFKQISNLNYNSKKLQLELESLESETLSEENELRIWKDDIWVVDWAKMNPKLSKVDLTPYFYFTRNSLNERYASSTIKLSPNGEEILRKLLSKSEFSTSSAIKSKHDVNDYESSEILEKVFVTMVSESTINIELFKAFMKWGLAKESLYANVVSNLRSLPGEKVKIQFIPLIRDFGTKTSNSEEINSLISEWAKTNNTISKLIDKE